MTILYVRRLGRAEDRVRKPKNRLINEAKKEFGDGGR
jgi:hypothetical protein